MRKQIDKSKCSRCQDAAPTIHIRNEGFCNDCFVFFINNKFRKRLVMYKVNYQSDYLPVLVVPVNLSRNSMALVQLLVDLQESQRLKHKRVGFEIEAVYFGDSGFKWPYSVPIKRFPASKLSNLFLLDGEPYHRTKELSRTSTQDLETWMVRSAIKKYSGEKTILYDYSMSYISELVMAETCKGRGSLVPSLINPESSIYPLGDILDSEIKIYAELKNIEAETRPSVPRVSKLQSIDELIHEFLSDTRKEFPAIDSTVARTGLKLNQEAQHCCLCEGHGSSLCYGCQRMLQGQGAQKHLEIKELLEEFEL